MSRKNEPGNRQNEPGHAAPYFWYPVALGFAGGLLLVLVAGFTLLSLACAILLLFSALLSGRHLLRLQASVHAPPQPVSDLRNLCLRLFPLWVRQISTSRHSGDEAALNLTRIFNVAVTDLETALSASRSAVAEISGKDGGILAAVNSSEVELHHVVEILKTIQHSKNAILADVTNFISDLKEMVAEVQHIALQVRILSFNAATEAAHAGESGAGFAVIAGEMRQLADSSAKTSGGMVKRIEKIAAIDATLTTIFQQGKNSTDADELAIIKADATIREVMQRFKQLTANLSRSVEIMERESNSIHKKIFDALEALQFQDRVSQILAHVADNLNDLHRTIEEYDNADLNAETWLHEMAQKFSTAEEFENIQDTSGPPAGMTRKPTVNNTTFF